MSTGTLDEFLAVARGAEISAPQWTPPADAGNPDAPCRAMFATMFGALLNGIPKKVRHVDVTTVPAKKRRRNLKAIGTAVRG